LEGVSFYKTTGFSMWPFLKSGERLVVKKMPIKELKIGDIILYRGNNQLVCHRLIKKVKTKERCLLYARGDNSNYSPELVTEEIFLGKAISIIKNGKIISLDGRKQRLINRFIVIIAPLISLGVKIGNILLRKR